MEQEQVLSIFVAARNAMKSAEALALYRQDNCGSEYLKTNYPHILSQADDLTLGWTLLPKVIVRSADILQHYLKVYRANLESGFYPRLPEEVSRDQYVDLMSKALDFFEAKVLPLIHTMPETNAASIDRTQILKVVNQLGLTDPIEEDYIESDEGGEDQESG